MWPMQLVYVAERPFFPSIPYAKCRCLVDGQLLCFIELGWLAKRGNQLIFVTECVYAKNSW